LPERVVTVFAELITQLTTVYTLNQVLENGSVVTVGNQLSLATNAYPTNVSGAITPVALAFSNITATNSPYQYNGQIQTDVGLSSGVVVKDRVVLTVAHALFSDSTLQWAANVRWFFEQHSGDYQAPAQTP